jgi:hypothetical protein
MDTTNSAEFKSNIINDEIRRTRKQQWQAASYILWIQAALIAFHHLANGSSADKINKWVFLRLNQASIIFSIAILLLGLLLIILYGIKLSQYQKLIKLPGSEPTANSILDNKLNNTINIAIESVIYLIILASGICSTYLAIMFISFCK